MIRFTATLQKQNQRGGWTYLIISAAQAQKLKRGYRVSFRIKGSLDSFEFKRTSLLPMGNGDFFLPINNTMRKATGKKAGDKILVTMEADTGKLPLSNDLLTCLKTEPEAYKFFKSLTPSLQHFYSKWIESAKTVRTKTKRITIAVNAFAQKHDYSRMMEDYRNAIL